MNDTVALILSIVGAISLVAGAVSGGWLKSLKETNNLLREQNEALREQYRVQTERYTAVVQASALLQGKIDVLATLPLKGIAQSLKTLSVAHKDLVESNNKILDILESSAVTLALENRQVAAEVEHVRTELANHPAI